MIGHYIPLYVLQKVLPFGHHVLVPSRWGSLSTPSTIVSVSVKCFVHLLCFSGPQHSVAIRAADLSSVDLARVAMTGMTASLLG